MKRMVHRAGRFASAAICLVTLLGAQGSGAVAQDKPLEALNAQPAVTFTSQPVVQPLDARDAAIASDPADHSEALSAASLADLVSTQTDPDALSPELRCLAGAIYFEAKSETLPGQLAVARVVVNRSKSGRFPASYCGVVYQPSQFSFVRGRGMPAVNTASQDWHEAVAIARIADAGSWRSPVEGALFFHAARVSPGWRLTRIARVDNHVFYR